MNTQIKALFMDNIFKLMVFGVYFTNILPFSDEVLIIQPFDYKMLRNSAEYTETFKV